MLAWTKRIDLFVKGARIERHTKNEQNWLRSNGKACETCGFANCG